MKLDYTHVLENNVRNVKVFIKSFGTQQLSIEAEKAILANYRESIEYKNIDFKGYYDVIDGNIKKVNPIVTYNYKLSVNIPTTYTTGVGINEHIVTIGSKSISFISADVEGNVDFITARDNAILDEVKVDADILEIYDATDISINNGKIVAEKSLSSEIDDVKLNAINTVYGVDSILENETSTQGGNLVTISPVNKNIEIKEGFEAEFSLKTASVKDNELNGYTRDQVAEMKVLLFVDCIYEAVENKVKEMKLKETDFESKTEELSESIEF